MLAGYSGLTTSLSLVPDDGGGVEVMQRRAAWARDAVPRAMAAKTSKNFNEGFFIAGAS